MTATLEQADRINKTDMIGTPNPEGPVHPVSLVWTQHPLIDRIEGGRYRQLAEEEFAAMACFLCSDHAGFTTGTAINMDGGATPVV